jgi:hypothetical protein
MGSVRFVGPKTIEVSLNDGGARTLAGNEIVLNLGSHAAIPDVPGLKVAHPLTHIEALELDELPPHLIVLGGGYTGSRLNESRAIRRCPRLATFPNRYPVLRISRTRRSRFASASG